MLRAAIPILCVTLLSGCSYSYGVETKMSDGQLVFSADPQWGADCVRHVFVGAVTEEGIQDAGVMWDQSVAYEDGCENTFPITYGDPLQGRPHAYAGRPARLIAPKPPRIGVLYEVHTTTGATGYGCGRFQMNPNGQVQNFACH